MLLAACGVTSAGPECASGDEVLVPYASGDCTCEDAAVVIRHVELLASRRINTTERQLVAAGVQRQFRADPAGTRRALAAIAEQDAALTALEGLAATEAHAEAVWSALRGDPPLGREDADIASVLRKAITVWAEDESAELILTEMDIEGWIRYISLCRQMQGGQPLELSVADRVTIYRMMKERFESADKPSQLALLSIGPIWPSLREAWIAAPYEKQQSWGENAPLPEVAPTSSSLGYVEAVLETNLVDHAMAIHTEIGPLVLGVME